MLTLVLFSCHTIGKRHTGEDMSYVTADIFLSGERDRRFAIAYNLELAILSRTDSHDKEKKRKENINERTRVNAQSHSAKGDTRKYARHEMGDPLSEQAGEKQSVMKADGAQVQLDLSFRIEERVFVEGCRVRCQLTKQEDHQV